MLVGLPLNEILFPPSILVHCQFIQMNEVFLSLLMLEKGIFAEFSCADPESFVSGGPNLTLFVVVLVFLVDEGPLYVGHHRPTSKALFKWSSLVC